MSSSNRSNNQVFDLEHCSLFLAANLLGGKTVLEARLQKHASPDSPESASSSSVRTCRSCLPLYWRSPLLMDPTRVDPASVMLDPSQAPFSKGTPNSVSTTERDRELDVVFVDVTFLFRPVPATQNSNDAENGHRSITLVFGALLRHHSQKNDDHNSETDEYFYVKGPPVVQAFLRDHVDQHDTVLEETKSLVIAKHLALALRQLHQPVKATGRMVGTERLGLRQVDIPLFYDDGSETSLLSIVHNCSNGSSYTNPLDQTVASTWLCGLLSFMTMETTIPDSSRRKDDNDDDKQQDKYSPSSSWKPVRTSDEAQQLLAVWETWKLELAQRRKNDSSPAAADGTNIDSEKEDSEGVAANTATGTNPTKKKKLDGATANDTDVSQAPSPGKTSITKSKPKVVRPRPMGMRVGGTKKKKTKTKNMFSSSAGK